MFYYLLVTHRCNLKCQHCIRGEHKIFDIDYEQAKGVLSEISQLPDPEKILVLTGGEPSIYPKLLELIDFAHDKFSQIILTSNGSSSFYEQHKHELKSLVQQGLNIQFSLDGDMLAHNNMRGSGAFQRSMKHLRDLSDLGIPMWVSTVVTKQNLDSIVRLRDELIPLNIQKWHVNSVLPFGCGNMSQTISITEWNDLVDTLIKTTPFRLGVKKLYDFSLLEKLSDDQLEDLIAQHKDQIHCNCGSGRYKVYIYPDLTVYGCTCLTSLPFGNLSQQSWSEILDSDNAKKVINYSLSEKSPCQQCRYVRLCNGGCIGMSYHVQGQIGMGDSRCPLWQKYSQIPFDKV